MSQDRETAMIEQLGKSLLIVLLELVILIEEFFLFLFVLELKGGVLEDIENDVFGLFFEEDVTDTEETG